MVSKRLHSLLLSQSPLPSVFLLRFFTGARGAREENLERYPGWAKPGPKVTLTHLLIQANQSRASMSNSDPRVTQTTLREGIFARKRVYVCMCVGGCGSSTLRRRPALAHLHSKEPASMKIPNHRKV